MAEETFDDLSNMDGQQLKKLRGELRKSLSEEIRQRYFVIGEIMFLRGEIAKERGEHQERDDDRP